MLLSIALHELGHYIPAKRFGLSVPEFSVGFGPKLFSKKKNGVLYSLRFIPLGGFIKIQGMYPPGKGGSKLVQSARKISQDEILDSNSKPFYSLTSGKKIIILFGGPLMNLFVAAIALLLAVSVLGLPSSTTKIIAVESCLKNCNIFSQKILPEDQILAINNKKVNNWTEFKTELAKSNNSTIELKRGTNLMKIQSTSTTQYGEALVTEVVLERVEPSKVLSKIGVLTLSSLKAYLTLPVTLGKKIQGEGKSPATGVLGTAAISQRILDKDNTVQWKFTLILLLLALVNIALFVLNMLPLPPLDGGHIALALVDSTIKQIAKIRKVSAPPQLDTAKTLPLAYGVAATFALLSIYVAVQDIIIYL